MPIKSYPRLDPSGWETDPYKIIDLMFATLMVNEQSQSSAFQIDSLPKILRDYAGKPDRIAEAFKDAAERILVRYGFEKIDISIVAETLENSTENFRLIISGTVNVDEKVYELKYASEIEGGLSLGIFNQSE